VEVEALEAVHTQFEGSCRAPATCRRSAVRVPGLAGVCRDRWGARSTIGSVNPRSWKTPWRKILFELDQRRLGLRRRNFFSGKTLNSIPIEEFQLSESGQEAVPEEACKVRAAAGCPHRSILVLPLIDILAAINGGDSYGDSLARDCFGGFLPQPAYFTGGQRRGFTFGLARP